MNRPKKSFCEAVLGRASSNLIVNELIASVVILTVLPYLLEFEYILVNFDYFVGSDFLAYQRTDSDINLDGS